MGVTGAIEVAASVSGIRAGWLRRRGGAIEIAIPEGGLVLERGWGYVNRGRYNIGCTKSLSRGLLGGSRRENGQKPELKSCW